MTVAAGLGYGREVGGEDGEGDGGDNRRSAERFAIEWSVDCVTDDTFLYAAITNISELGIFVACDKPFEVGTLVTLNFAPSDGAQPFRIPGRVQWINQARPLHPCKNPGMGIQFVDLNLDDRERIVEAIHTIAYVRDLSN